MKELVRHTFNFAAVTSAILVSGAWASSYFIPQRYPGLSSLTWGRAVGGSGDGFGTVSYGAWYQSGYLAFQRTLDTPMFENRYTRPIPESVLGFAWTRSPRDASLPIEGLPNYWVPRLYIQIPFWLLMLVVGPPAAIGVAHSLRLRRRQCRKRNGLCPSCGYDIRASPGCCPECGEPAP